MLNTAFGRVGNLRFQYDLGRTTTHEVGHWLNLFHIWGDDGTACSGSDQCDDTPNQGGANQSNCPGFPHLSCDNTPNGDMFMNYMDYTVDGCKNTYTQGQTNRMRAIFAQGGPRANFIDNYFRVNQPTVPICNTGTVTALNPNCLPITWDIVSGPAVIVGGQNTNIVTLQRTGDGIAVLRATAGGYFDEKNIIIGTQTPTNIVGLNPPIGVSPGELLELDADNVSLISYAWTVEGGHFVSLTNQSHVTLQVDQCPPNISNGYLNVHLSYQNTCGTGNTYTEWTTVDCGTGGGMYRVSPNPALSNVIVEGILKNKIIKEIRIIDKIGNIKKQIRYSGNDKKVSINVSNLPNDIYYIQIFDGKVWESKKISVLH